MILELILFFNTRLTRAPVPYELGITLNVLGLSIMRGEGQGNIGHGATKILELIVLKLDYVEDKGNAQDHPRRLGFYDISEWVNGHLVVPPNDLR